MGVQRNNTPREYFITVSTTLTIPVGAYVKGIATAAGGGGRLRTTSNAYAYGGDGGNTSITDGTNTYTAAGGLALNGSNVGSPGNTKDALRPRVLGNYGAGGDGIIVGSSAHPEMAGFDGETITFSFIAAGNLTITIGAGGAPATIGSDNSIGGQPGFMKLKIYPYGQPQDGLPAHP